MNGKEEFMIYLRSFSLLDEHQEYSIVAYQERRKIFNNYYPLQLFSSKQFQTIEFGHITIFCGGNGSGKTTLINMISEKLKANRKSNFNKGSFFDYYVDACRYEMSLEEPNEVKLVTSDDVFDYLLDIRSINSNVSRKKEKLSEEYLNYKYNEDNDSFDQYEKIRNAYDAKNKTMSKYVRERLGNNTIMEKSNGESALLFFEREIREDAIYILDEPENSLSVQNQIKLKQFIEESVRFYNCQFIISTHSPFLLKLQDALIYDLDSNPVVTKKWSALENIKLYYQFFKENEEDFKK